MVFLKSLGFGRSRLIADAWGRVAGLGVQAAKRHQVEPVRQKHILYPWTQCHEGIHRLSVRGEQQALDSASTRIDSHCVTLHACKVFVDDVDYDVLELGVIGTTDDIQTRQPEYS